MATPTVHRAHDPEFRWRKKSDGEWEMPELPAQFLDWMMSFPRVPDSQAKWCAANSVDERTVRRWKNDLRFKKEWEARANELNISPERVQAVIDNLFKVASQNEGPAGVKAADLFLQMVDKYTPRKQVVITDTTIENLTYDELMAMAQGDA